MSESLADDTEPVPGARLRELRQARGLTVFELAEAAGITFGYLASIEGGIRRPSAEVTKRLAAALEAPPSELRFVRPPDPLVTLLVTTGMHADIANRLREQLTSGARLELILALE